jgi:hypothetical protein
MIGTKIIIGQDITRFPSPPIFDLLEFGITERIVIGG